MFFGAEQTLALQLCRSERGRYPDYLADLVPDYLPRLPVDPYSGNVFAYVPFDDAYLLYSLGPNRCDDGGLPKEWDHDGEDYDLVFTVPNP